MAISTHGCRRSTGGVPDIRFSAGQRYAARHTREGAIQAIEDFSGDPASLTTAGLVSLKRPAVLRGLAAAWPIVRADDKAAYLKRFDSGAKTEMSVAPPEHEGRLFYTGEMDGLTFTKQLATVSAVLDRLQSAEGGTVAAQAVPVGDCLPGFADENQLAIIDDLDGKAVQHRIWIGNRVVTATHHDMFSNLAVVVAGRRRFTLFPPGQVVNLYLGPFEFTPAGTPASLVDPEAPDLDRFPRAAQAMDQAMTAELGPGDAIYIPHMWWHHVRSLDEHSILVNYWWDAAPPPQPGLAPMDVFIHALLVFESVPEEQRAAWQAMFDHFVFQADGDPNAHIPEGKRGIRGKLDADSKARLRRTLAQMLGR
jgi:mannose-6-phosphate isomerase-like protein (cupin superfamily)